MRVLVTGHLGYIGSVLTPMLIRDGHDVVGLDCDLYRGCDLLGGVSEVETIYKDLRDIEQRDLDGFDSVVHLAALSNDPLGDLCAELTYDINHHASVQLARYARERGISRFVFSSSCSLYGAAGDAPVTESAAFNPITPYAESKVRTEQDISKLASDDFSPVFLRNATAYGVSPRLRFDVVVNNLVGSAVTSGLVLLRSDGSAWRPLVHVEDICRAILAVLQIPRKAIHNEAFNVGVTRENYRIRDVADIVAGVVPNCRVEFAEGASADARCYRVGFEKIATRITDFRPEWTVQRGVQQLYSAFMEAGIKNADFQGNKFQRVARIKALLASGALDSQLRFKCVQTETQAAQR